MITLKSCPNCESGQTAEYRVMLGGALGVDLIPDVRVNTVIVTRYCRCKNCNLIFQNPRLSDVELDIYYGSGYYRRTINPPPEGMDKGEQNRAKIDTQIIKRYVGKLTSHLDIGCGLGYLLDMVGARVKVGTESDPEYVKAAGIKLYSGMHSLPGEKFDLVTAIHVLEHVPYPLVFLEEMRRFVKRGGYVVIEVPSLKTRGGPLGFAHLSYFEPDVLKLMCLQVGLEVIHMEFTPHLVMICKLKL